MVIGRRVTVVGAGIAGLAVARALALRGASVQVMERAPAISEVGAGLQISPNGFAVLGALGLEREILAASDPSQAVILRDHAQGRPVVTLDLTGRGPFRLIHRADLIEILAQGARQAGVEITLGTAITTPSNLDGDLVIGADGVRSVVRDAVLGQAAPTFTGQTAWRALVPIDKGSLPAGAQIFMGPGRHVVIYPLRGGSLANIVAVAEQDTWHEEGWSHQADPVVLRADFARFGGAVAPLLATITQVYRWGLFRHPIAPAWSRGRCVLLGDAAHPTLPFLAQGANLALEDAWVLADCLAADWDSAMARYQARRQDRVTRVVAAATANARNYHLRHPVIRGLAHTGLRVAGRLAPRRLVDRFDWIYGFDPTAE